MTVRVLQATFELEMLIIFSAAKHLHEPRRYLATILCPERSVVDVVDMLLMLMLR